MTNILKELDVNVRCAHCGEFTISADTIADSQRLLEHGCPGSPSECPAQLFSTLVDRSALEELATAWKNVEKSARAHNGRLVLEKPHINISLEPEPAKAGPKP